MTEEPLRSVHTNTFPALLEQLNISLLVTTYQAGKLVALRADDGVLNTHFRSFAKPMGLVRGTLQAPRSTSVARWSLHSAFGDVQEYIFQTFRFGGKLDD